MGRKKNRRRGGGSSGSSFAEPSSSGNIAPSEFSPSEGTASVSALVGEQFELSSVLESSQEDAPVSVASSEADDRSIGSSKIEEVASMTARDRQNGASEDLFGSDEIRPAGVAVNGSAKKSTASEHNRDITWNLWVLASR